MTNQYWLELLFEDIIFHKSKNILKTTLNKNSDFFFKVLFEPNFVLKLLTFIKSMELKDQSGGG